MVVTYFWISLKIQESEKKKEGRKNKKKKKQISSEKASKEFKEKKCVFYLING